MRDTLSCRRRLAVAGITTLFVLAIAVPASAQTGGSGPPGSTTTTTPTTTTPAPAPLGPPGKAKIRKGGFTLEDFRDQLRMLKRMGPLDKILGMLPGMGGMKELAGQKPDEKQLGRIEAIINSMTPDERKHADILDGSRRKRVAKGSGTTVEDVNRLLKQFVEMQRMLKMVGQMTGEPIAAAPKKKKKKGPFSLMK